MKTAEMYRHGGVDTLQKCVSFTNIWSINLPRNSYVLDVALTDYDHDLGFKQTHTFTHEM